MEGLVGQIEVDVDRLKEVACVDGCEGWGQGESHVGLVNGGKVG